MSVFTVPSKKASLYCSAVVPKSTALVVLGLSTDAVATMSCDGPIFSIAAPSAAVPSWV